MRILIAVCMLGLGIAFAGAQEITGTVSRVIDGDTLQINELRVRLCGIDAPEDHNPGAAEALEYLEQLARGKEARCVVVGGGTPCDTRSPVISSKRVVAQCFVGELDLAADLVAKGHACDWPKFSGYHYADKTMCTAK
ncbi:thermonuclease family protein [Roseibium sediminis]|uniref:thermonuclease family protein n=1 Tax=Roseibium sediminis TaxID=1775174 RepID=UPI00123E1F8A|nr:thermonuclease family protein [Roseibium sediminis]